MAQKSMKVTTSTMARKEGQSRHIATSSIRLKQNAPGQSKKGTGRKPMGR